MEESLLRVPEVINHKFEHPNGFLFQVSDNTASFVAPNGNILNIPAGVYTKNEDNVHFIPIENYENVGIRLTDHLVESTRSECNYVPEWIVNATTRRLYDRR